MSRAVPIRERTAEPAAAEQLRRLARWVFFPPKTTHDTRGTHDQA